MLKSSKDLSVPGEGGTAKGSDKIKEISSKENKARKVALETQDQFPFLNNSAKSKRTTCPAELEMI